MKYFELLSKRKCCFCTVTRSAWCVKHVSVWCDVLHLAVSENAEYSALRRRQGASFAVASKSRSFIIAAWVASACRV